MGLCHFLARPFAVKPKAVIARIDLLSGLDTRQNCNIVPASKGLADCIDRRIDILLALIALDLGRVKPAGIRR
jgi:hypothetical protein